MNSPLTANDEKESHACEHCGTNFRSADPDARFCCSGCAFVHEMIAQEGFDRFYDLKGEATTRPVENLAFEQRDYAWLEEKASQAEKHTPTDSVSLDLGLDGASCAGCVWLIERVFSQEEGGLRVLPDPLMGRVTLNWEKGRFDASGFAQRLQQFGYTLSPLSAAQRNQSSRDPLLYRVGLCAAFAMNGMAFTLPRYLGMPADFMFASLFQLITALTATLALAVGGSYFIRRAIQAWKQGLVHVDLPIALGIVLAYTGSLVGWLFSLESMLYFDFVAIFVFLMLGGRWLQEHAMRRNRRRLLERETVPESVLIDEEPLPISQIQPGQVYVIKPNDVVPVASVVRSPSALLGMEWIQGESETREQAEGSVAASGAIHRGTAPLHLEARETWPESLLYRLTLNQEPHSHYPFLQQVLKVYLSIILAVGLLGGAVWMWRTGEWTLGLQVTLSIFVISCPCALGIAVPLADDVAAAAARKLGVFIQQLSFWSRLRRIRRILFDKTGTLTLDTPQWTNPEAADPLDAVSLQRLADLAASSSHPISRSLSENLAARRLRGRPQRSAIESLPGVGLQLRDSEDQVWTLAKAQENGGPQTEFRRNGDLLATFHFRDTAREGAAREIQQLREAGLEVHIMSGDHASKVEAIADDLGLPKDAWHAGLSPDDKARWVDKLDQNDSLFVGDGANDSLAFDRAYATATPAFDRNLLTEKADCYFVTRALTFLTPLIQVAERRQRLIREVFAFTVFYNLAAISVCLSGHMNPLLAAILMPISSLITTSRVALGFRGWKPNTIPSATA